jgi:hypothetical protein
MAENIEASGIPNNDKADYTVTGTVSSPDRAGVGGLRVLIVDQNIGQQLTLAETATDARGNYKANFAAALLQERGKDKPDIQALVFAQKTLLAASEVRYNASHVETLHVRLAANTKVLPSEHETLSEALFTHFKGKLSDLQESKDRQDITYLANKSGWDARAVALAALADQFSNHQVEGASIPSAFYYGLFRAGLPANPDVLYHADVSAVEQIIKQSLVQGIIPSSLEPELPKALDTFRKFSVEKMLTAPALVGASSIKDMLTVSGLDEKQKIKFAELQADNRTDLPKFWQSVADAFGKDKAQRLQVDGKLGFLTINNAPLIQSIHQLTGRNGLSNPLQLAQMGYHRPERWETLLSDAIAIPNEVPGDTAELKRKNYAKYLAAQIRLSYPTASVAEMVKSGALPLLDAAKGVADQVHAFLTEHQGNFEIGVQPVQQYIIKNGLTVPEETVKQVMRVQRVYQISGSDDAMAGLLKQGIDAAYHVVQYDKDSFVEKFAKGMKGEDQAALTYDRSVQVHNTVLNIAVSYLTAKNGIPLGSLPLEAAQSDTAGSSRLGQVLQPAPLGPGTMPMRSVGAEAVSDNPASDVIAYATLEALYGSMDFCTCDHCRSILSPAAYLVDLLQFIDKPVHPDGTANPQDVLFQRRPDIQHLALTCENTNTALPYIDIVNETLEYFVTNFASSTARNAPQPATPLQGFKGHDTGDIASLDLMANPQFVMDEAYTILRKNAYFPPPLPFHQPLETVRRYLEKLDFPLVKAMEALRVNDGLERPTPADADNPIEYGCRDIWLEEIGSSRAENEILSDSNQVPLGKMFGFPDSLTSENIIAELRNAKNFSRRVGITYEDLINILKTRFVNPNSHLIPKLEKLGMPFATLKSFGDHAIDDVAFDRLLHSLDNPPDPAQFGAPPGASADDFVPVLTWVKNEIAHIMGLIVLIETLPNTGPCSFDALKLQHADRSDLDAVEFTRILRFIRLWKKLGWTIAQTDAALCALLPLPPSGQVFSDSIDTLAELDTGFSTLLPCLGVVKRVMHLLNLTADRDLLSLLTCWSNIGIHGDDALYRKLFLNPAILKQDSVFADDGSGNFLVNTHDILSKHAEALRGAFNLTGEEFTQLTELKGIFFNEAGEPDNPERLSFNLGNISAIYRRGWLARKMKLSIRELLLLIEVSGIDPFAAIDPTSPAILRFIELVESFRERDFKIKNALYMIWNQDMSGHSATDPLVVRDFARSLRLALNSVESELAIGDDPDGSIAQSRMTLVYGAEATTFFFGLLYGTFTVETDFSDPDNTWGQTPPTIRSAIERAAGQTDAGKFSIVYDDFRKKLIFSGLLTAEKRDAILAAASTASSEFVEAITQAVSTKSDSLYALNQSGTVPFFSRYPELENLSRGNLLANILPELKKRRKAQQILQALSTATKSDYSFAETLLNSSSPKKPLHAFGVSTETGLADFLALEKEGLSVQFFAGDSASGTPLSGADSPSIAVNLDYSPRTGSTGNPLPVNPTPGSAVSGIWSGYLEAPDTGFFNFYIDTDAGARVKLKLDSEEIELTPPSAGNTKWQNSTSLQLRAGSLYHFELTVEIVRNRLRVQWAWDAQGQQGHRFIPARYLYPEVLFEGFEATYLRYIKASSIMSELHLSAEEFTYFASNEDYYLLASGTFDPGGEGWLNYLPNVDNLHFTEMTQADMARTLNANLGVIVRDLLDFARIKANISSNDDSLLKVLQNPEIATEKPDSLFYLMTRLSHDSLITILNRFSKTISDLKHFNIFRRVYEFSLVVRSLSIPAEILIDTVSNEPSGKAVLQLESALRARYDAGTWREVIKPINDSLRSQRRDALVAWILHQMCLDRRTEHIDTADKLFEYFLMDVQMEPCMQTSRIRHAISSVQLFIERCLMNLEPRVSSKSITAKQWEWMKRYRVWEANRKVFLYPENWLEPELRDDSSTFFKEAMSELLQGDITEDSAATVLTNYLTKLHEVAKLDPCGIHYVESDPPKLEDDVTHVIACTQTLPKKYYYRSRDSSGWSPWEQINLNIEGEPVIPVIWKKRLFLFWLMIIPQGQNTANIPASQDGAGNPMPVGAIINNMSSGQSNPQLMINVLLCWSEYYKGKWQPAKTSDNNHPAVLNQEFTHGVEVTRFDRSKLRLSVAEEDTALRVRIDGQGSSSFLLYNSHSLPVPQGSESSMNSLLGNALNTRQIYSPFNLFLNLAINRTAYDLHISYHPAFNLLLSANLPGTVERTLLTSSTLPSIIEPRHLLKDSWIAPFFFSDNNHVFYVTTEQSTVKVDEYAPFGLVQNLTFPRMVGIPPLAQKAAASIKKRSLSWSDGDLNSLGLAVSNPAPMERYVTEDAFISYGIGMSAPILFGNNPIGPGGAIFTEPNET